MEDLVRREHLLESIFRGRTVLITGDTGFKGSWLAIWLAALGANVIGYALPPANRLDNYVICGLANRITHIEGDVRDLPALKKAFSEHKPALAFHLAAQALVMESYQAPEETFSTNIMGTVNFFEAVRAEPSVRAAVNVTSDKCYLPPAKTGGFTETDRLGGNDPYSASKAAAEIITGSYQQSFFTAKNQASVASVRAGNVIGGGDWSANRLFPDCMRALLAERPIQVRNPEAVRPWQHVLEPLSGYLILGALLFSEGRKYSGAWNFGPRTSNMIPVKELVNEVIRAWGRGSFIYQEGKSQPTETDILNLDSSKAARRLDWHPVLNIRETVEMTLSEYKTALFTPEQSHEQRLEHIREFMRLKEAAFDQGRIAVSKR